MTTGRPPGNTTEVIVGPRYRTQDIRVSATNTVVLETDASRNWPRAVGDDKKAGHKPKTVPQPVAGPIVRYFYLQGWCASCERCNDKSKEYKRKNDLGLWRWAYRHRCPPPTT